MQGVAKYLQDGQEWCKKVPGSQITHHMASMLLHSDQGLIRTMYLAVCHYRLFLWFLPFQPFLLARMYLQTVNSTF